MDTSSCTHRRRCRYQSQVLVTPAWGRRSRTGAGSTHPKGSFVNTQPSKLVKLISRELGLASCSQIFNWELELQDSQPVQTGGLDREFIFGGRIDDKLRSWAAFAALLAATPKGPTLASSRSKKPEPVATLLGYGNSALLSRPIPTLRTRPTSSLHS
ncbi:Vacuolar aminopeptidase 1 [Colletotrichum musicola]|uniref:Vacuolar aminopeptidase 1 n=1 Tax=Colletotrichum musicola TaxID=2175873 RepID=A0A8H6MJC3_9PEZI|nr:Vacuolar aminopeptidase 1 [Colletotrichum musicola]